MSERRWHDYVSSVYHAPLPSGQAFDLNKLTFFYKRGHQRRVKAVDVLLNHNNGSGCLSICRAGIATRTYLGTPWVAVGSRKGATPGAAFGSIGFFVRRAADSVPHFRNAARLEVAHVETTFHGGEIGVAWFFHAVGSGVFLDCHRLPTKGRVVVHSSRRAFEGHEKQRWLDDVGFPRRWMRENGVAMVIFTREDFRHWVPAGANPRTEIVVLLPRSSDRAGTCLHNVGVRTLGGWGGESECECSAAGSPFLNCDGRMT
jgi:hypothetical protein